ncbi:MAG: hypothetical protein IT546_09575 [Caulobacteraceae bacterium]|nr:hypothetical protein [Caulobacteraceae bacterium]
MKFSIAAAAAAFSLACAGGALAAEVTVKLVTPVSGPTKVIAGGAVFNCVDTTCVAKTPTARTISSSACKELTKEVGAISTFGDVRKQLDGDKLARCNGDLPVGTQVANR